MIRAARHIWAVLAIVFALGVFAQGVQNGAAAAQLALAGTNMPTAADCCNKPAVCDACDTDSDAGAMQCMPVCVASPAVLPTPAFGPDQLIPVRYHLRDESIVSRTGPPDPFPPKLSILV